MSEKHPNWTRRKVGRNRVHWVAYDDRPDAEDRQIVDQGYAASLPEADAAARSALANAGMYQARRLSASSLSAARSPAPAGPDRRAKSRPPARPREFVYTRHHDDQDDVTVVAAHLVIKKSAKRIYVTRRACGLDQLGTDDEAWTPESPTVAVDRVQLEREGSAYCRSYRLSDFYATRDAAMGDAVRDHHAFRVLGLQAPCTAEDIKTAYRRRAFEVHPDRGGSPGDFQAVEAAYRQLLREAQVSEL
jgi:hypothetical protein